MRPCSEQDGFAMLACLVVVAVAAVYTSSALAAAAAMTTIGADDDGSAVVRAGLAEGLDVCGHALRGEPASGRIGSAASSPGIDLPGRATAQWRGEWHPLSMTASGSWPCFKLDLTSTAASARGNLQALLEVRQDARAAGLVVRGETVLRDALTVRGSGLYCGGSVDGRQHVSFSASQPPTQGTWAADNVHGEWWPAAAVHAGGDIRAGDVETHERGLSTWPMDTDRHVPDTRLAPLVLPLDPALLSWLRDHAALALTAPAATLDVGRLATATAGPALGDLLVYVSVEEGESVGLAGERPADAGNLTLVVNGNAEVLPTPDGAPSSFRGLLAVTGSLTVSAPFSLQGHVSAGDLIVRAPCSLTVPPTWKERPSPGFSRPVALAMTRR